jgi:thymidylate synthase
MVQQFTGLSADEVWLTAAREFHSDRNVEARPSRAGMTKDMGQVVICIANPMHRWVVSREPAMNPAFAIAEAVWILNGRKDARFLNFFNRSLPRFAGNCEEYHGAYGHRLRYSVGFDQLDRAYLALSSQAESRQVVLQIWDSRLDMPAADGTPTSSDVPCNVISMLKIRNGTLEWTQVMRSNDIFRGFPYNVVQFTILQEVFAGWMRLSPGPFHLFTDSLHLYDSDLPALRRTKHCSVDCAVEPLALPKDESERVFADLARTIELIIDSATPASTLTTLVHSVDVPLAYKNLLSVLVAEGLRRRQEHCREADAIALCSNATLRLLWEQWSNRFHVNV